VFGGAELADSKHQKPKGNMWGGAFLKKPSVETIRRRASRSVRQRSEDVEGMDQEKARQLVHELRVKRMEVEALEQALDKQHNEVARFASQAMALFDASTSGFVKITLSDTILECNQSFAKLCGKPRHALEGMEVRAFIKSEDRMDYLEFLRNCSLDLHGNSDAQIELTMHASDNTAFAVRMHAIQMHIPSENDDPEVWLCIDRATSQDTYEEKALATYDTSAFFNAAPEGFVVFDKEGLVQEWNEGIHAITGIAPHMAIGKHLWNVHVQLVPEGSQTPDTVNEFRQQTLDAIHSICERGELKQSRERLIWNSQDDCRIITAMLFPIRRNGDILLGAIIRDVTEDALSGDENHPSEIRYQALFNALKAAVLILDEGKVIECNHCACELFDLAEEELVSQEMSSRFPESQPGSLESAGEWNRLEQLSRDEHYQEFEWQFLKKDGCKMTALVQMHHLSIGQKSLTQIILRDMDDIIRTRFQRDTLTAALDQTDEIMILCDEDFQVQYVNATFDKHYALDATRAVTLPDMALWKNNPAIEAAIAAETR
jgi:PAS domain S-box-containing protein